MHRSNMDIPRGSVKDQEWIRRTSGWWLSSGPIGFEVYPGGEHEQMLAEPGREIAYWGNRKGFVRLAVQFGVPLIPAYCFGENDCYSVEKKFLWHLRMWMCEKLRVAMPMFRGRGGWSFWIRPVETAQLSLVVGRPMAVQRVEYDAKKSGGGETFKTAVDEVHARFVEELRSLFERHKGRYGMADRVLEVLGGEVVDTGVPKSKEAKKS